MRYVIQVDVNPGHGPLETSLETRYLPLSYEDGVTHIENGSRACRKTNDSVTYRRVFHQQRCVWAEYAWGADGSCFLAAVFLEDQLEEMRDFVLALKAAGFVTIAFGEEYTRPLPEYRPDELLAEIERLRTQLMCIAARFARGWYRRFCMPRPPVERPEYVAI